MSMSYLSGHLISFKGKAPHSNCLECSIFLHYKSKKKNIVKSTLLYLTDRVSGKKGKRVKPEKLPGWMGWIKNNPWYN